MPKYKLGFHLRIGKRSWFINIPSDRGDCGYFPHWTIDYLATDPYTVSRHTRYILKWFWVVKKILNPNKGSFVIGQVNKVQKEGTSKERNKENRRLRKFN